MALLKLLGQGGLDEHGVDVVVGVERVDERVELFLRGRFWQNVQAAFDADFARDAPLLLYV